MRVKKFLFLLVICFYLFGCGSLPEPRIITNIFTIEADFDSIWTAIIETFSDLQLPIQNIEKASGLITTDWIDFTGETGKTYADYGKLALLETASTLEGKFNVFVKEMIKENSYEIRVNCTFEQNTQNFEGDFIRRIRCVSTGELEAEIYELILSKIDRF